MSRCHMVMKHSKPGCTRDEWDQMVADHGRAEEARVSAQGNEKHLEKLEVNGAGG